MTNLRIIFEWNLGRMVMNRIKLNQLELNRNDWTLPEPISLQPTQTNLNR